MQIRRDGENILEELNVEEDREAQIVTVERENGLIMRPE